MDDLQQFEQLLTQNLVSIDAQARRLCRAFRMSGDEIDDFVGFVHLRLVADEYAILRKFRGESKLTTFLNVVIAQLFHDHHVSRNGRWRPSAAASRLGALAVRLETLIYRDGCSLAQAGAILRSSGETDLPDKELWDIAAQLRPRTAPRPTDAGADPLDSLPANEEADAHVTGAEDAARRSETLAALNAALAALAPEDRTLVFAARAEDVSIAEIARGMGLVQKPLYRRVERILATLRASLEAAGFTWDEVRPLLGKDH